MATEVKVPSMGESINSGILAAWHVSDGDTIKRDQVLYELETDKITSEGVAEADGVISLKAEEGEEVEIGQVVAVIEEGASGEANESSREASSKAESKDAKPESTDSEEDSKDPRPKTRDSEPETSTAKLSPAVRKLVEEHDLNPSEIVGSGKDGRLTKGDVLDYIDSRKKSEKEPEKAEPQLTNAQPVTRDLQPATLDPQPSAPLQQSSGERTTRKKLSPLRKKIGERLVMAQRQAAILSTFNEVDLSAIMKLRKEHQEAFVEAHEVKLGFMSFFIKAVVHALKAVPQINTQIEDDTLIQNHFYDIGVAIGTDRGLIVPVIRDVEQRSFAGIEKEILRYAQLAKEGKISIEDLQGGVFTISNGGVYGSLLSTPILNPPQSGILGMHTIQQRPVAVNGEVVIRPMMYIALSYDHRLVDGKEAVTFLIKVKEAVENPTRLLFEI